MNESDTTRPIWTDPVARIMFCIFATVASAFLLFVYVTAPYFLVPSIELWHSVTEPLVTQAFGSPKELLDTFFAGPVAVGIVTFVVSGAVVMLVAIVPLFVAVGLPLTVSYLFWMTLVYRRVLDGGGR